MKDTGGPAFPVKTAMFDCTQSGMTLRDYFAAKAMQALITRISMSGVDQARKAYEIADSMLKARSQ
jgi:hypothetical protein